MPIGLIAQKIGMSRVFAEDGSSTPVTVLGVMPNRVTQVKTVAKDGYAAVQMTVGERRPSRVTKPAAGHFAKAGVAAGHVLKEFRLAEGELADISPGAELKVDIFKSGQKVDIQGTSIGKGYAGVVKRYGFRGGRATHGCSLAHRKPGSIGQNQDPGRVFPGKKMSGHMGDVNRTQQGLKIVRIDVEKNLMLVKGSIPGSAGSDVFVQASIKSAAVQA
ncbi:MAG: 50S ribosomal protein L3 [Gammaproteobacteria bacterium]|nr:50S ribosomal protein L3 [Gammaproteobacteria bacterium]